MLREDSRQAHRNTIMPLAPGTRFGQYEVVAYVDAGGMGEVYRARDTVLGREVALKVPHEAVWADADRAARFEREARVLASLNHPNIATIHGLERLTGSADSVRCIVLELVEGPTLADRLLRGPMSVEAALGIARQLVDALESAHAAGVVHRDLKPANIKLRPDGTPKVLDFGLAKALDAAHASMLSAPAATATREGLVLGTAAYMSPEQARGEPVDQRTDIWAFGCVVYEMLTGLSPFAGSTATDSLAAVLERELDWSKLPAATPPGVRRLLPRCLQKERRRRLADIRDARFELEDTQDDAAPATLASTKSRWPFLAATAAAVALAAILAALLLRSPVPEAAETRLEIMTLPTGDPWSFAVAPDGRRLAFVGIAEGRSQLWLRPFDVDQPRPLPGTDGASLPFWSPDGRSIGFFADGQLKRLDVEGGAVRSLASAASGDGGAWGPDDTILFSPNRNSGIFSIAATGGVSTPVTELVVPQQQNHVSAQFLPDGRHFLYYVQATPEARGVYLAEIGAAGTRRLLDADAAAAYLAPGYLLFVRQATLYAQRFDVSTLELVAEPFAVAEGVMADAGASQVALSVADAGQIAYRLGTAAVQSQLVWYDRAGRQLGNLGDRRSPPLRSPSMSPDGRRVAFYMSTDGNTDVWLLDADRGVPSRFTFDAAFDNSPLWSPDGTSLVFASSRGGVLDLYRKGVAAAGGAEELLFASPSNKVPTDWSRDGRFVLYRTTLATGFDVLALSLSDGGPPVSVATTGFEEREAQFSPDGKWVAYQSNESGRFEIYVQPFPTSGGKSLVSTGGGAQVRWRADGRELFYLSFDNRLMAVPVELGADGQSVAVGTPAALFQANPLGGAVAPVDTTQYVVSPDGQQFLFNGVAETAPSAITILANWKAH